MESATTFLKDVIKKTIPTKIQTWTQATFAKKKKKTFFFVVLPIIPFIKICSKNIKRNEQKYICMYAMPI